MEGVNKELVYKLRERTGCSLHDCIKALQDAHDDLRLAEGILKYKDCAVACIPRVGETREEARHRFVMDMAQKWAEHLRAEEKGDA